MTKGSYIGWIGYNAWAINLLLAKLIVYIWLYFFLTGWTHMKFSGSLPSKLFRYFLFSTFFATFNLYHVNQLYSSVLISNIYCIIISPIYRYTCLANYSKANYAIATYMVIILSTQLVVCKLVAKTLYLINTS